MTWFIAPLFIACMRGFINRAIGKETPEKCGNCFSVMLIVGGLLQLHEQRSLKSAESGVKKSDQPVRMLVAFNRPTWNQFHTFFILTGSSSSSGITART